MNESAANTLAQAVSTANDLNLRFQALEFVLQEQNPKLYEAFKKRLTLLREQAGNQWIVGAMANLLEQLKSK